MIRCMLLLADSLLSLLLSRDSLLLLLLSSRNSLFIINIIKRQHIIINFVFMCLASKIYLLPDRFLGISRKSFSIYLVDFFFLLF